MRRVSLVHCEAHFDPAGASEQLERHGLGDGRERAQPSKYGLPRHSSILRQESDVLLDLVIVRSDIRLGQWFLWRLSLLRAHECGPTSEALDE